MNKCVLTVFKLQFIRYGSIRRSADMPRLRLGDFMGYVFFTRFRNY